MATENPSSLEDPPRFPAHTKFPLTSSLLTKISAPPFDVKLKVPAPGSKSAVPSKYPVANTLPEASVAIESP